MRPIPQQIIVDINEGKGIKDSEMDLRCVVESRVATAGMLMHKNPLGNTAHIEDRRREKS